MASTHKLYISYSASDNKKQEDKLPWVDDFVGFLEIFLLRITGESPEFVRIHDKGADGPKNLGENEGLVLITSPNYIKDGLHKKDAPLFADPSRVFKVDLTPIKKSDQPVEIRSLPDFHFFESAGTKSGDFVTMDSIRTGQSYWLKVIDLAYEVSMSVYHRKSAAENTNRNIFLAECSYDQVGNRDEIKRELHRHGFNIIPEKPFSDNLKDFEAQVMECLSKADVTVQIIGEEYGEVPSGTDKSIVEIQNDLATKFYQERRKDSDIQLERLIWMPLYLKPKSDQQKLYLDRLREDISSTEGAEIIQTPLEILKTVIHTRLQILEKEKQESQKVVQKKSDKKSVYLLYDKKDEKDISDIVNSLNAKNISVIMPDFNGQQIEMLRNHRDNLIQSDGVLLYANKNLNWVNSKLNDVIKAPGFGKIDPFDAKAVFIKNNSVPKEKIANFGDILVLNGDGKSKDSASLDAFTDQIAKS